MHRRQLSSHIRAHARVIRDEPFPKGLRGLIEETVVPTGFNSICKILWTITPHGSNLLEALKTNNDFLPPKGIGVSARARAQRDAECDAERLKEKMAEHAIKHVRRLKHERRLRNPKHPAVITMKNQPPALRIHRRLILEGCHRSNASESFAVKVASLPRMMRLQTNGQKTK